MDRDDKIQIVKILVLTAGATVAKMYFKRTFIAVALGMAAIDTLFDIIIPDDDKRDSIIDKPS